MTDRKLELKIRDILYQHELNMETAIMGTHILTEELVKLFKKLRKEKP